jgi:hypothetical protein
MVYESLIHPLDNFGVKPYLPPLRLHHTKGNHVILIHKTWSWLTATIVSNFDGSNLIG